MTPSTEHFVEELKRNIAEVGEAFTGPDDDWIPMFFVEDEEGNRVVSPLPGEVFSNEFNKDYLVQILGSILRLVKAVRFGLLLNAWSLQTKAREGETMDEAQARFIREAEEWRGRFQDHPDRKELLSLLVGDRNSTKMWTAWIERHEGKPPTHGEWELAEQATGRFIALGDALKSLGGEEEEEAA